MHPTEGTKSVLIPGFSVQFCILGAILSVIMTIFAMGTDLLPLSCDHMHREICWTPIYTVKPVPSGHPQLGPNMAARDRWPLSTGYTKFLKKIWYLIMSKLNGHIDENRCWVEIRMNSTVYLHLSSSYIDGTLVFLSFFVVISDSRIRRTSKWSKSYSLI